jgi:hypothetical protein
VQFESFAAPRASMPQLQMPPPASSLPDKPESEEHRQNFLSSLSVPAIVPSADGLMIRASRFEN